MKRRGESPAIDGVLVVVPEVHGDERGVFVETYRREWFPHGREMVQGNRSDKQAGAVVGLHFHLHQADYWYVPHGSGAGRAPRPPASASPTEQATTRRSSSATTTTAACGSRPGSPTGSRALTDLTMTYLVDQYYNPADELGVAWDDPAIAADWGIRDSVVLSARDQANPSRASLRDAGKLPVWGLRT